MQQGITTQQREALTQATLKGWALGDADFVTNLQNLPSAAPLKPRPGVLF